MCKGHFLSWAKSTCPLMLFDTHIQSPNTFLTFSGISEANKDGEIGSTDNSEVRTVAIASHRR